MTLLGKKTIGVSTGVDMDAGMGLKIFSKLCVNLFRVVE